jgi:hypothetical protein
MSYQRRAGYYFFPELLVLGEVKRVCIPDLFAKFTEDYWMQKRIQNV